MLIKWWELETSEFQTKWKKSSHQESKRERKPTLRGKWVCFQWKAHRQCSKGDSCSFSHDRLAQGDLYGGQRRKGRSSSPAPNSKAKIDEGRETSSNTSGNREEISSDKRSNILCRNKNCKTRHVNLASSRVSKLHVLDRMHENKNMFLQTCWGWGEAQQKVKETWCERISCFVEGVYTVVLCISRLLSEKVKNGDLKHAVKFSKGTWHKIKIREREGSIARNYPKVWTSWA